MWRLKTFFLISVVDNEDCHGFTFIDLVSYLGLSKVGAEEVEIRASG